MTIQEQYTLLCEGKYNVTQFKKNAAQTLPNIISVHNSFEDVKKILLNKGIISEAVKKDKWEQLTFDADRINPYELQKGITAELTVPEREATEDEYFKAKEKAVKNIQKDPLFYTNKITGSKNISPEKRPDIMKIVKDKMTDDMNKMKPVKVAKIKDEKPKKSEVIIKENKLLQLLNNVK
jgi:hypothetical protein